MSTVATPRLSVPAAVAGARVRLASVDLLRGIVMVIMALDHVRDFFTNRQFDPGDLSRTSAALFFTRDWWLSYL